ncbi:recombination protein NinB [Bradyrhizobium sp.]|uniref:recombination protein NinB n=1 Tax=Bradyrhizobium sp. TaxID=376 RepID=UPI0025C6B480|nr:recombination protein NinB [Bradyrhizobium sp.]
MSRATLVLVSPDVRDRATRWIAQAKPGTRVEFKEAKRSLPQNDRFWAMLTDVATQVVWHGRKLTPDDWKYIFLDALKREVRAVPNIDGTGFVNIGRSSSDLSKAEMSDLLELIAAFGANHGVTFHEPETAV